MAFLHKFRTKVVVLFGGALNSPVSATTARQLPEHLRIPEDQRVRLVTLMPHLIVLKILALAFKRYAEANVFGVYGLFVK